MEIFKWLNKKLGKCCTNCGKRSKVRFLSQATGRMVCATCYRYLRSEIQITFAEWIESWKDYVYIRDIEIKPIEIGQKDGKPVFVIDYWELKRIFEEDEE